MTKTLIIDPGHGGPDHGAIGHGIREKDWNLRMSQYIYNRLQQLGMDVAMTRYNDIGLDAEARTKIVRESGATHCISNHFNSFSDPSADGVETIHSIYADRSDAYAMCKAIVDETGLRFRRVFSKKGTNGDWYFMHRLTGNVKTTIIEYGFLSNRRDVTYYMDSKRFYGAAEAMVKQLCALYGVHYKSESDIEQDVKTENIGTLKVALQDLKLTTNKWKTQVVDVKGTATLKHNVHVYAGSPNFNDWVGVFDAGTEINFINLSIPHHSDLVWMAFEDRFSNRILQIPIGTVEGFNRGEIWIDIH